jgi:hypothetical protein
VDSRRDLTGKSTNRGFKERKNQMSIKRKGISSRRNREGEECTVKEEDYEQIKEEKRIFRSKKRSTRSV